MGRSTQTSGERPPRQRTTALWLPAVTPSKPEITAAILYQDRFSTLVPAKDHGSDASREAKQLQKRVGDLYQPLAGDQLDFHDAAAWDVVVGQLRERINEWRRQASGRVDDEAAGAWLRRFEQESPSNRARSLRARQRSVVDECRRTVDAHRAAVTKANELEREAHTNAVKLRREAGKDRAAAKEHSRKPIRALLEEREELLGDGWGVDQRVDARIREIEVLIKQIPRNPVSKSQSSVQHERAQQRLLEASRTRQDAQSQLKRAERHLVRADKALDDHEYAVSARRFNDPPPIGIELTQITGGKVAQEIVEFLHEEARMWVSIPDDATWVTNIHGPRFVLTDLLNWLGEWYCSRTPGWIALSKGGYASPSQSTLSNRVALFLHQTLPVPDISNKVDAIEIALELRSNHEEELFVLRSAVDDFPEGIGPTELEEYLRGKATDIEQAQAVIQAKLGDKAGGLPYAQILRTAAFDFAWAATAHEITNGVPGKLGAAVPWIATGLTASRGAVKSVAPLVRDRYKTNRAWKATMQGPYRYLYTVAESFTGPS